MKDWNRIVLWNMEGLLKRGFFRRKNLRMFYQEEDGMGTIEIILIIVVLIGLVMILKKQMTSIVNSIFEKIVSQSNSI